MAANQEGHIFIKGFMANFQKVNKGFRRSHIEGLKMRVKNGI
jgi:hypothetical protein